MIKFLILLISLMNTNEIENVLNKNKDIMNRYLNVFTIYKDIKDPYMMNHNKNIIVKQCLNNIIFVYLFYSYYRKSGLLI